MKDVTDKNNDMAQEDLVDSKSVKLQWVTPELRTLPVPGHTQAGFLTKPGVENLTYKPS